MVKKTNWKWAGAGVLTTGLAMLIGGCNAGNDTVATVGGEDLERDELHSHLEATHGPDALQQLIDYTLVMQNLQSKGLQVTDAEISAAIARRQEQEPEIAEIVQGGGTRLEALQRQVRYQLALDKLLTQDVKVDENTLKQWFEKTREYYDQPESVKIGILRTSSQKRAEVMAEQLKNNTKSFLELVQEQQKANDPAARASIAEVPEMITVTNLPDEIRQPLAKLQKGQTSEIIPVAQPGPDGETETIYSILRLIERQPAQKADFTKLRAQIEEDYKMEQVARRVISQVPQITWEEIIPQVRDQVAAGQPTPPTYNDMLRFITTQLPQIPSFAQAGVQGPANRLIQSLRTSANVTINDTDYEHVGEIYRAAPGADQPSASQTPAAQAPAGNAPAGSAPANNSAPPAGNAAP